MLRASSRVSFRQRVLHTTKQPRPRPSTFSSPSRASDPCEHALSSQRVSSAHLAHKRDPFSLISTSSDGATHYSRPLAFCLPVSSRPSLSSSLSSTSTSSSHSPHAFHPVLSRIGTRSLHSSSSTDFVKKEQGWRVKEIRSGQSRFPDYIEQWNRANFWKTGIAGTVVGVGGVLFLAPTSLLAWAGVGLPLAAYFRCGIADMKQNNHALLKNFPVLGHVRYLFESIRPEIRQYFVESDTETVPYSREQRNTAYQRAKGIPSNQPLGTRRDVYQEGYEWVCHSMYPTVVPVENQRRMIGGPECTQPHSASLLNISGMSYGALSSNAILALNTGAKRGGFYHNTGEGGISRFHLQPGGDIAWNIGTGYFGCRDENGQFSEEKFIQNAIKPQVKIIEVKMSQGAKPGHGGILPAAKVTETIAEARGMPMGQDCVSPARHSAFEGPTGLLKFIQRLRKLSGGKPVGFKLCVGRPDEITAIVRAMVDTGIRPDFITVDGGEGGTGAAPPEFSNHVGMPLAEGLVIVNNLLRGAGVRNEVTVIASGRVITGFGLVKTLALGADVCNAARAMMFALGCIQALKCHTNTCPTGVATQNAMLMAGLVPEDKATRVFNFHRLTVESAMELIGAVGVDCPSHLSPRHIYRRVDKQAVETYETMFPNIEEGCLLHGKGPEKMQAWWDESGKK